MSDDRALLEWAAKAAGLTGYVAEWISGPYFIVPADHEIPRSDPKTYDWLNDDGDALRLAVKLRVRFWIEGGTEAENFENWTVAVFAGREFFEPHGDANAATRRAIVRAAAFIGSAS